MYKHYVLKCSYWEEDSHGNTGCYKEYEKPFNSTKELLEFIECNPEVKHSHANIVYMEEYPLETFLKLNSIIEEMPEKKEQFYRLSKNKDSGICGVYPNYEAAIEGAIEASYKNDEEYEIVKVVGTTLRETSYKVISYK